MTEYTTQKTHVKLCECGCGKPTPLAKRTRPDIGHVKGQPTRFVAGHNSPGREYWKPPVRPLAERFWEKVDKRSPDECWIWKGNKSPQGYGFIVTDQKMYRSHRVCYELCNGPIPKGMYVCHRCDNPQCVNPSHLWLGTPAENNRDRANKKRNNHTFGELHPSAKINSADVVEIRKMAEQGVRQRDIATLYGITQHSVWSIIHRKTWQHVP